MPELPEVETIVRRLSTGVVGKKIAKVSVLREKSFRGSPVALEGRTILSVARRSKIIQFNLNSLDHLLVHLKMTGQLILENESGRVGGGHPTGDFTNNLPSSHTRVVLVFDDGSTLYFNDMRVFGWMKVVPHSTLANEYHDLAPDITDPQLTPSHFIKVFATRSTPIKQAVMNNAVVAGVGNIYAADALNLAKIDPHRPANSLQPQEVKRLFDSLKTVIELGIVHGGASIDTFVSLDGLTGRYQDIRRVYKREGLPCPNCQAPVVKVKLGGRGTFFCRECQV